MLTLGSGEPVAIGECCGDDRGDDCSIASYVPSVRLKLQIQCRDIGAGTHTHTHIEKRTVVLPPPQSLQVAGLPSCAFFHWSPWQSFFPIPFLHTAHFGMVAVDVKSLD